MIDALQDLANAVTTETKGTDGWTRVSRQLTDQIPP